MIVALFRSTTIPVSVVVAIPRMVEPVSVGILDTCLVVVWKFYDPKP